MEKILFIIMVLCFSCLADDHEAPKRRASTKRHPVNKGVEAMVVDAKALDTALQSFNAIRDASQSDVGERKPKEPYLYFASPGK